MDGLKTELLAVEKKIAAGGSLDAVVALRDARIAFVLSLSEAEAAAPAAITFPIDVDKVRAADAKAGVALANLRKRYDAKIWEVLRPAQKKYIDALAALERELFDSGNVESVKARNERERASFALTCKSVSMSIPDGAVKFGGHYYYLYEKALPWAQAVAACQAVGGHLVTITSVEENKAVLAVTESKNAWLGLSDQEEEGSWKWVTGEPFSFSGWWGQMPDNHQGKQHWGFYWVGRGWDDTSAGDRYRYVCEWGPPRE